MRASAPQVRGEREVAPETFRDAVRMAAGTVARSLAVEPALSEVVAFVERETVPEERDALLSAAMLGGAEAARGALDARFGGTAWLPFRYVRLRPPRHTYAMLAFEVTFFSDVGWHKVSAALAAACAEANDLELAPVFDVSVVRPCERVVELTK